MVRAILTLFVGVALGAGSVWLLIEAKQPEEEDVVTPAPEQLRCESELKRRESELAELKRHAVAVAPTVHLPDGAENEIAVTTGKDNSERAHAWRLSAIERFVPLSDEQKTRLQTKFSEERKAQEEGRESTAESLDDILGAENAKVYREQVNAAFERVQNEELEKDTMWTARKLGLSADQEDRMRSAFAQVEQELRVEYPQVQHGSGETPQKRVLRMIAENKRRLQLRAETMRRILSPEQYEAYVRVESESSASDMEVFHGSGEGDEATEPAPDK